MLEIPFMKAPNIKEIRKKKRITQAALAEAMGVSPGYLSMIESGQKTSTPRRLLECAIALDVNPSEIAPPEAYIDSSAGTGHFLLTILDTFRSLDEADQENLLSYGEFLLKKQHRDPDEK